MPRKPLGDRPMTNAERQARHRAARAAAQPVIQYRRAADRCSRARRWCDAVTVLVALQAEYTGGSMHSRKPCATALPARCCKQSSSSTSTN
jgi:uncharacterized membrane protein